MLTHLLHFMVSIYITIAVFSPYLIHLIAYLCFGTWDVVCMIFATWDVGTWDVVCMIFVTWDVGTWDVVCDI